MTGGIFTPQAFHPNPKCIYISLALAFSYWILPKKNITIFFMILIITYIVISWYDYLYDCDPMLSGSSGLSFQSLFKPRQSKKINTVRDEVLDEDKQAYIYLKTVYIFHLIVVAPYLIYTGYRGNALSYEKSDIFIFSMLIGMGSLAGLYHGLRLFMMDSKI